MNSLTILAAAALFAGDETPQASLQPATVVVERILKADVEPGSISGTIVWEGDKPEPKPKLTIKDKEAEGCKHTGDGVDDQNRTLLIGAGGGVANVVVTVEADGVDLVLPEEAILMDQRGCRFEPHVVVVPVGATLRFANSDDTNHNIHTFAKKNQAINKNVAGGSELDQKLEKDEVIDVKCDVHTWMKGYIVVTDATHWAVTAADGSFSLEGLPPGDYKLSWWHEELGKGKTESVTVVGGETVAIEQKVGAAAKSGGRRRRR